MAQTPHMPSSADCFRIAELLETAATQLSQDTFPPKVLMRATDVWQEECGTCACHAGHYLLAKCLLGENESGYTLRRRHDVLDDSLFLVDDQDEPTCWSTGATAMAIDLGFGHPTTKHFGPAVQLMNWAQNNPDLWGNTKGHQLFNNPSAFFTPSSPVDVHPPYQVTIEQIIDHWKGVAKRLQAREQSNQSANSVETQSGDTP